MSGARKRKRLDAVKHPFVEGRLQGEKDKPDPIGPEVPLKNGGQMEIGWRALGNRACVDSWKTGRTISGRCMRWSRAGAGKSARNIGVI